MEKDKTIILFKHFLKKHKALKFFNENLKSRGIKDLDVWLMKVSSFSFISGAFGWSGTPQGTEYWQELANKWRDFLHTKGIQS
jgi:hypothetical protein